MRKKLGLVSLYNSFNDNNINKLLKIIYFFLKSDNLNI